METASKGAGREVARSGAAAHARLAGALVLALVIGGALPRPARADRFDDALALLDAADYAAAQDSFEVLAAEHPQAALPLYYAGVAAARRGQSDEAALAFARAAELDPELPWLQASLGIALYRVGELDLAEAHLLEALLQGPDDAEVLLHLGLIDLERGAYERAIPLFEQAATLDPDFAALPLYHAARAQWAQGDDIAARALLLRAEAAAAPERSREQARRLLAEIETASPPPRAWAVDAGMGIEFDDNLTVPELDGATGVSDVAGVFDLALGYRLFAESPVALALGYDFYQSVYRRVDSLNYRSHSPSLELSGALGPLGLRAGYRYAHDRLAGASFLDSQRLIAGLGHALRPAWQIDLGLDVGWLDFAQDPLRDATRVSLLLGQRLVLQQGRVVLAAGWRPEHQDARDPQLDYWSNALRARAAALLPLGRLELDAALSYEYVPRRYEHVTLRILRKRSDDRHSFGIGLALALARRFEVTLDYLHILSRSNLPEIDYDENRLTLRLGIRP